MLVAVPNGGIGPDYGGILARGWAAPEHRPFAEWYFTSAGGQHHNGTGVYENHRWRAYTSNDEFSGYYSGLALVAKYVDEPDVRALVTLLIDQVVGYMVKTNFLGIDAHGGPTGVHQRALFGRGGSWILVALRTAALVLPEKYETLYLRYAFEEYYAWWTAEGGAQETVSNYYAFAFGYHITMALILLEDNPFLRGLYLEAYNTSLRHYTQYHRNAFYNIIHLALTAVPGDEPLLERDVEDQLIRYGLGHFPDRALGRKDVPAGTPLSDAYDRVMADAAARPLGFLYRPVLGAVLQNNTYLAQPLTVEYMNGDMFIWEKNPFVLAESVYYPQFEYAGFAFSIVYWMGRAFGFMPAEGVRA
jgi:hypothetical protein